MTATNVTYTKAIKNGVLKTSQMEVGSTVSGVLTDLEEGQYGKSLKLDINGREVLVYPSGNLKKDANDGRLRVGTKLTITRQSDVVVGGNFTATNFAISTGDSSEARTSSIQEKIEAMKAGNTAS